MPCSGLCGSGPIPGHSREVQDVWPLQEGLPSRCGHLGEESTGGDQSGEVHPLSIVHPGLQILGHRIVDIKAKALSYRVYIL